MEEARKIICPVNIKREAPACVSSQQHQMCEVRVLIPKCRAYEARISEALPHRRDVQQHEVRISSQRHEIRISTSEWGTHEVHIFQVSPDKCDNQQYEIRVSSQRRHKTCILKPKCESHFCPIECELRVSEPHIPEAYISE